MEDGPGVEEAIASAFEDLDLVVEPFHKTTVLSGLEIVGNRPPVSVQGFDEPVTYGRYCDRSY